METIVLVLVIGLLTILSFTIGAKVGQKIVREEDITIPKIEPLKAIKEYKLNKEQEEIMRKYKVMLENVETYDGTSTGQQDI